MLLGMDLLPFFVTFVCCLFWKLEYGIIVGAGVQCFFILYNSARPDIRVETYKVSLVFFIGVKICCYINFR